MAKNPKQRASAATKATKSTKAEAAEAAGGATPGLTVNQTLDAFTLKAMTIYATAVNEDRSVPDIGDGLKPVQRRTLWAASTLLSSGQKTKTARLSGDTTGKYHPHGSTSVDGAIETMVNSDTPPIEGIGNFGGILDSAAAARYTEVKITKFGNSFTHSDYTPVCDKVKNYDFTGIEPIVLPALYPAVFLNTSMGIGVGLTTCIPSFKAPGLLDLCESILRTGQIPEPKAIRKKLVLNYAGGGEPLATGANKKEMLNLIETGVATIKWSVVVEDYKGESGKGKAFGREYLIRKFPPTLNFDTFIEKVRAIDGVKLVYSGTGLSYIVRLTKSAQEDEVVEKIVKAGTTAVHYKCNVTHRSPIKNNDVDYSVKFISEGVLNLLMLYLKIRVRLELKSLAHQITRRSEELAYTELLIHACSKLDIIFKGLKRSDTEEYIARGLKITADQTKQILDLRVRQLKKLDADALSEKRKNLKDQLKKLETRKAKPNISVADFYAQSKFVTHDKRWAHLQQQYLQ